MKNCYFKIKSIPIAQTDYNKLPWGRQIEYRHAIKAFQDGAKTGHISQKRRSFAEAFVEFIDLYKPKEYFCLDNTTDDYKDDSIQVWYKD